jgi:hypothetical protein
MTNRILGTVFFVAGILFMWPWVSPIFLHWRWALVVEFFQYVWPFLMAMVGIVLTSMGVAFWRNSK